MLVFFLHLPYAAEALRDRRSIDVLAAIETVRGRITFTVPCEDMAPGEVLVQVVFPNCLDAERCIRSLSVYSARIVMSDVEVPPEPALGGTSTVYKYLDLVGNSFYIGASTNLSQREANHNACCKKKTRRHFYNKLNLLRKTDPALCATPVRENLSREVAFAVYEPFFIAAIGRDDRGKGPLTNETNGGDGTIGIGADALCARVNSILATMARPEVKRRQSESAKISQNRPDVKARQAEINARPDVKERRSKAQQASRADPVKKAAFRDAMNRPEVRALRRALLADEEYQRKRRHAPPRQAGKRFKGIYKRRRCWRAILKVAGKSREKSGFFTEFEAAAGYNALVTELQGGDGWLNRVDLVSAEAWPLENERRIDWLYMSDTHEILA